MANFASTIEYKFKVTNNLDKADVQYKKFNFYIGLPYSKRKYRYMQVINFATNKEGQHLFNVVLGHSESSVAAMTDDILRGTHARLNPAVATKVSRITYASLNVGCIALVCNDKNEEIIKNGDWTGISGEYTKVKSFRTNGDDEVIGLIFDAADRSSVSARKNDSTNVVAKAETPDEVVKVPQTNGSVELEEKLKFATETLEYLRKDLENRDKDISALTNQLEEKDRYIKGLENDSIKMFQNMDWRRKYIELVLAVLKRDFSHMKDEDLVANVQSLIELPGMGK